MTEVSIEEIEYQKEINRNLIKRRDALNNLEKNSDFKEIILNGFCLEDCARYLQNSTDNTLSKECREDSINMAKASGYLITYFNLIKRSGDIAENELYRIEQEERDFH